MKQQAITPEHSQLIIRKMCDCIGIDPDRVDFTEPNWYEKHTWTPEQEESYIMWLTDFLEEHKYAHGMRTLRNGQKVRDARHEAEKLVATYGWKTVE